MAGGSEISNELTLDVSDFTQGLERATKKLDSFNTKLDSLDNKSEKLEKDFKDLSANASQAAKSMGAIGTAGKQADDVLASLVKDSQKAQRAFENMSEWTNHYGKSLDSLRPKMDSLTKSTKELHSVTAKTTAEEAKAIQAGIQSRAKDLHDEQRVIGERIKARKQMISQLEQLERRAETSAAYARADAFKINADGKEVPRYRGKNIGRQRELEAEIAAYQKEAQIIRQQKEHVAAIVGEMSYRNAEIGKAIAGEKQLLQANEQQLEAQRKARQEAQKLAQEKKEQAKAQAAQAKQLAKETAAAEKQAVKDALAAQKQAHKEIMAMRHEELKVHRDIAAFATGAAAVGATSAGVKKAADYQDVEDRLRAYNFTAEETARVMARTESLIANNKFLSKTEALQGSIDAISALAHNDPKFIDETLEKVMRDAFILKAKGYDKAELSDIIKNLYAAVEKRGLATADYSKEAVQTSDLMRRMVVASGGKVTVADMETVMNNIGSGAMTISDDGWLKLLPLIEQTKTSGGGNGGGGGVARVGTLIKMLQLLGSGRKLTNVAAQRLVGAGALNDIYKDGAAHDFKKGEKHNQVMSRALMTAGFKNSQQIASDPVGAMQAIRGGIMDFMMREGNFKEYFGKDARKHSYDQKGRMIDADGKMVDKRTQANTENAALLRFLAPTGMSNNNVTGMMTLMNPSYAERANHSVATAKNTKSQEELIADLSNNWNQNIIQLKAQLANLAITFEPLLRVLTDVPKALTSIIKGVAEFGQQHNTLASMALVFASLKVAMVLAAAPLRILMALIGKSPSSLFSMKNAAAATTAALGILSGKSKDTGAAVTDLGNKATKAGDGAKKGFGNMASSALASVGGVRGALGGILRVVGLALNWVGWITLGAMLAGVIAKWVADIKVGQLTVGQHMSNFMAGLGLTVASGVNGIRKAFYEMVQYISAKVSWLSNVTDWARRKVEQVEADQQRAENLAKDQTTGPSRLDTINKGTRRLLAIKHGDGFHQEATNVQSVVAGDSDVPTSSASNQVLVANKGRALNATEQANLDSINKNMLSAGYAWNKAKGEWVKPEKPKAPKVVAEHIEDMPEFNPTPGFGGKGNGLPPGMDEKEKKKSARDFIPQNAYDVSLAALKEEQARDNSRINELLGGAVDYDYLARQSFIKEWMQGKLDDGRDPSQRKFANREYKKGIDWTEGDINWNDPKVQAWVNLKKGNLQGDGLQKSLEFAAGKLGESVENAQIAYENWNNGSKVPSDTQKARREYAKFEAKNVTSTENSEYQDYKLESLSRIAATNYATLATELREKNKELNDTFLENDTQAMRNSEARRYESEVNKINAVRDSLDEQIKLVAERFGKEDKLYKELVDTRSRTEAELTKNLEYQNKLRVQNTRSAYDQTMSTWRDLESNLNSTLSSFGQRAGTDIWDIISGDQDLDVGGYFGDLTKSVGSSIFKKLWGQASLAVMGEGEGTSVVDMVKNFATGKEQSSSGWLGKYINGKTANGGDGSIVSKVLVGAQGWLGKFFGGGDTAGQVQELTGDQAVNANTSALQQLTMAITGAAVKGRLIDTPVALPGEQAPAGVDIVPFQDRTAVDPSEGPATSGFFTNIFTNIKSGFNSIFNSGGEGGIFSKIKDGFGNLFSEKGGLMSKIGGSFSSLLGGLGSALGGLFGGSGSKVGGVLSGALEGGAQGGWMGAIAGGISGLFANGGAFGASGQVHAFAKGGAFTNEVYNSPTMFKFANGGQFGVMGEAGPEAVMPLQRDGSGRLGVAVNGGQMGGNSTAVNIEINVTNNGEGTSETSSSDGGEWGQLAQRVKSLVQSEIVQQKRPGGMLRNSN